MKIKEVKSKLSDLKNSRVRIIVNELRNNPVIKPIIDKIELRIDNEIKDLQLVIEENDKKNKLKNMKRHIDNYNIYFNTNETVDTFDNDKKNKISYMIDKLCKGYKSIGNYTNLIKKLNNDLFITKTNGYSDYVDRMVGYKYSTACYNIRSITNCKINDEEFEFYDLKKFYNDYKDLLDNITDDTTIDDFLKYKDDHNIDDKQNDVIVNKDIDIDDMEKWL